MPRLEGKIITRKPKSILAVAHHRARKETSAPIGGAQRSFREGSPPGGGDGDSRDMFSPTQKRGGGAQRLLSGERGSSQKKETCFFNSLKENKKDPYSGRKRKTFHPAIYRRDQAKRARISYQKKEEKTSYLYAEGGTIWPLSGHRERETLTRNLCSGRPRRKGEKGGTFPPPAKIVGGG